MHKQDSGAWQHLQSLECGGFWLLQCSLEGAQESPRPEHAHVNFVNGAANRIEERSQAICQVPQRICYSVEAILVMDEGSCSA